MPWSAPLPPPPAALGAANAGRCCHSFIKQYLNASNADEVEHLKSELESVKAENAALQKELAELKVCSHPLPASCPCSARLLRLLVRR